MIVDVPGVAARATAEFDAVLELAATALARRPWAVACGRASGRACTTDVKFTCR